MVTVLTVTHNPDLGRLAMTRDSVLAQTLSRWAWVVVDDGSEEALRGGIGRLVASDRRMLAVHVAHRGLCAARAAALDLVGTEYVVFLDDDDMLAPTALEKAVWFLETNAGFAAAGFYTRSFGAREFRHRHGFVDGSGNLRLNTNVVASVARAALLRGGRGRGRPPPEQQWGAPSPDCFGEDWHLWLDLASRGHWGFTIPEFLSLKREIPLRERAARFPSAAGPRFLQQFTAKLELLYPELYRTGVPDLAPVPTAEGATVNTTLPFGGGANGPSSAAPGVRRLLVVLSSASGGDAATRFADGLLRRLVPGGWNATVVFTMASPSSNTSAPQHFEDITHDVFELPNFIRLADAPRFLGYLARDRAPDMVLIGHSQVGYLSAPLIRQHLPAHSVLMEYVGGTESRWYNTSKAVGPFQPCSCFDVTLAATGDLADRVSARKSCAGAGRNFSATHASAGNGSVLDGEALVGFIEGHIVQSWEQRQRGSDANAAAAQHGAICPTQGEGELRPAMAAVWRHAHAEGDVGSPRLVERRIAESSAADVWGVKAADYWWLLPWRPPTRQAVVVLLFETESQRPPSEVPTMWNLELYASQLWEHGVPHLVVGSNRTYRGWGSKWLAVQEALGEMVPDTLVVVSDARDVLLNRLPVVGGGGTHDDAAVARIAEAFESLVRDAPPGAIVVGTEGRCCVAALTHVGPGELFMDGPGGGARGRRACRSGHPGCPWRGAMRRPWEDFMDGLAASRNFSGTERYLNAGLVAGRAGDLLRVVEYIAIGEEEDDQAVLTGLLHHRPEWVVLDYRQVLFGNSRFWLTMDGGGCPYNLDGALQQVTHAEYGTHPHFVHAAAQLWECYDAIAASLGYQDVFTERAREARHLSEEERGQNYGAGLGTGLSEGQALTATAAGADAGVGGSPRFAVLLLTPMAAFAVIYFRLCSRKFLSRLWPA